MEAERGLGISSELGLVRLFIEIWGCKLVDGRTDPAHRCAVGLNGNEGKREMMHLMWVCQFATVPPFLIASYTTYWIL